MEGYLSYGKHGYGLPTNSEEMNHLDLQHHKYALILNHKYFPLVQPPANLRSQYGRGHLGSRLRGRVSHYLSH